MCSLRTEDRHQEIILTLRIKTPIQQHPVEKIYQPPITPGGLFHQELMDAKNKAKVIDVLCTRGSSQGWFSDMPPGLFEKLQGMRTVPKPAEPEPIVKEPEWFRDSPTCEVCEE